MSRSPEGDAFEGLLGHASDTLLLLVDHRLRIVRAGSAAAVVADRAADRLAGMSLIAAFGSVELDAVARQALFSGVAASAEASLGRPSARSYVVDAVPIAGGALVLSLQDVTALRRAERMRRDFVANISHELRTPLASIKLLAETLSGGAVDDPGTARDFSVQIEREVDHLTQLVDELLDLSMIESGETQLTLEPLDPRRAVEALAERIRPVAERRSIVIRLGADPGGGGEPTAQADPGRLGQALLNLAHNAVKYSHPNGEVRIGWEARDGCIRFTVADDGIGVPRAHQARIFERFYKVDRSRARDADVAAGETGGGSAGLGLAIVRHIAEAHGGRVGVESAEGVGSTFWIEIPSRG